jgi:UDP-glucose 4-epimerase
MNILITGGAGFVGSHLAERCLREDWSVSVIDDLSTGSFENIAHLKRSRGFEYTIDTVLNAPLLAELVDRCDVVFHLAAAVGVRLIVESPVRTIDTNVRGTDAVLRAAAKKRKRVVITSTSEVYGKSAKMPFSEDDDLVMGPTSIRRWSYACSKALDEFLGLAYFNEKNVPVTIIRLFNTVGPRQTGRYGMVVPTFVRQALLNEPITVYGDGTQRRCFGYVLDVVEALVRIAKTDRTIGEIINIGNDQEISIAGLAALIRKQLGSVSDIETKSYKEAYGPGFEDMHRRIPSVAKLERLVGFRPRTSLSTIIDAVAAEMIRTGVVPAPQALEMPLSQPAFQQV